MEHALIQYEMTRLGLPLLLDDIYPPQDRDARVFLAEMWGSAVIGAEVRVPAPDVKQEAARTVAHALFVLNFGAAALARKLQGAMS